MAGQINMKMVAERIVSAGEGDQSQSMAAHGDGCCIEDNSPKTEDTLWFLFRG